MQTLLPPMNIEDRRSKSQLGQIWDVSSIPTRARGVSTRGKHLGAIETMASTHAASTSALSRQWPQRDRSAPLWNVSRKMSNLKRFNCIFFDVTRATSRRSGREPHDSARAPRYVGTTVRECHHVRESVVILAFGACQCAYGYHGAWAPASIPAPATRTSRR